MVPTTNTKFCTVCSFVVDPGSYFFWGLADPDPSLFYTDPNHAINKAKKLIKTLLSTILQYHFDFFS
jgi:hypothetical protein